MKLQYAGYVAACFTIVLITAHQVSAQTGSHIYGSTNITYNEQDNTLTLISSTELDYNAQDWYAPKVDTWVTDKAGNQVFYGMDRRVDGHGTATVTATINAVYGEEYNITARHTAPYFVRDFNQGGQYIDYWGFQSIARADGEGGITLDYLYMPYFATGPRQYTRSSLLVLGDTTDETMAQGPPDVWVAKLIEKGYNQFRDVWSRLTNAEKNFVKQHPIVAVEFYEASLTAIRVTAEIFNPADNRDGYKGNAFQHAYWNAIMTSMHGADLAAEYGTAHEEYPSSNDIPNRYSKEMDLHNNAVGRTIGLNYPGNPTHPDMITDVLNALNLFGQLEFICPGGPPAICERRP